VVNTDSLAENKETDLPPTEMKVLFAENQRMLSPEYAMELEKSVQIPPSSYKVKDLETLQKMTPTQRDRFFRIRNQTLNRLARFFKFSHLKPKVSNKVLNILNSHLFENARPIGTSQRDIYVFGIGGALGLSLSKYLNRKLQGYGRFKNISENAGVFWAFSIGLMIVKTTKDGTTRLSLEPVADFRRAQETLTPFVFGALNLILGRFWEVEKESKAIKKSQFARASFLTLVKDSKSFGLLVTPGAAFPPMAGYATSVVKGDLHQVQLNRTSIKGFLTAAQNFLKPKNTRTAILCRKSLLSL
jgi:hypothetical protein